MRNRAATTHVDQHKPTIFCSAPATAGRGPIMCVPCSTAICAGWHGRGVEPQATCDAARSAHLRRRERGQAIRLGLLAASRRPREMDAGLLETKVVELNIVDHASDNTIGRVLKKTRSSLISCGNGSSHRKRIRSAMEDILAVYATESVRWSVWTRRQNNRLPIHGCRSR